MNEQDKALVKRMTLNDARRYLAEAVLTQGEDYVYNPGGSGWCTYVPWSTVTAARPDLAAHAARYVQQNEQTGCIVGTALELYGVSRDGLTEVATEGIGLAFPEMDPQVREYLAVAQCAQDNGTSWGRSLLLSEAHLSKHYAESTG